MQGYNEKDLARWEEKIIRIVEGFGLDPFPQIFEICDHQAMLGYMAYSGMPSRYPHWSFGKHFEKQQTLHKLGMAGLPYEMVINANPSLAYLMTDNTLLLQILTMAHVYAHNDFFKNNMTFRNTAPEYTLEMFKADADRIRKYQEDPQIGVKAVETILDAAHALAYNVDRFDTVPLKKPSNGSSKQSEEEDKENPMFKWEPAFGRKTEQEKSPFEVQKKTYPPKPVGNLLLFIRDNNPNLTEWQRDLLTIVHRETMYFVPQIETKIMNEGWASLWHYRILEALELPQKLQMEFYVRHNQVVQPIQGSLNPYFLGFKIWLDIEKRWDKPSAEEKEDFNRSEGKGREKIFQVRESDRDEAFLRQYLTEEMMRELFLFRHEDHSGDRIVSDVSNDEGWKEVKQTLLGSIGMNSYPVIRIIDANFEGPRQLLMKHEFEGRELDEDYTAKTLKYFQSVWMGKVFLETKRNNKDVRLSFDGENEKLEVF